MMQDSMDMSTEELCENFSLFDDWEEKYRYLIDLGRKLPDMEEKLKTENRLVPGCTSRVWMQEDIKEGCFYFLADSDAHIVRGLIAVLFVVYNGKSLDALQHINIEEIFSSLGLDQHLSPNRRSGFFAIVEKIRAIGRKYS